MDALPISAVVKAEKEDMESRGKRWPKTGSESKRTMKGLVFSFKEAGKGAGGKDRESETSPQRLIFRTGANGERCLGEISRRQSGGLRSGLSANTSSEGAIRLVSPQSQQALKGAPKSQDFYRECPSTAYAMLDRGRSYPKIALHAERKLSMIATTFEIIERQRKGPFDLVDIKDFQLREIGQLAAEEILENPHISLYSLDFQNRQAVFVEIPSSICLSQSPFYFITQYENAIRVLTVSFETMIQMARSITIDDRKLIFIHSVGRSGSTLAGQIFAHVPGVVRISEPDALTLLVKARYSNLEQKENLIDLLKATICLLCKMPAKTAWVIKGRSYVIELGDWVHELYPQIKNLFLYRHAETWLESCLRAYSDNVERTNEERRVREDQIRKFMVPMVPLITQYDANEHLSHASILALVWLTAMERYVEYSGMGIEMLAIQYANWRLFARETTDAMLRYCQCKPDDMTVIYDVLTRDSQAGTVLSQDAVKKHDRKLREVDLEELNWHLKSHDFINEPDYKVINTLDGHAA